MRRASPLDPPMHTSCFYIETMFQIYVCVQNISVDVTNYGYICKDFI